MTTIEKTNGAKVVAPAKPEPLFGDFIFSEQFPAFDAMRRFMSTASDFWFPQEFRPRFWSVPAVNLYEKNGDYMLECSVPGYEKEDLKIETSGDAVKISGTYSHEKSDKKPTFHRQEVQYGSFTRTIPLPQEIDPDKISAKLEKGVLKLTLHPLKAVAVKTIPINT